MGRVDAFNVPGLSIWFNSSDHLAPHFHAEKSGEWEYRVFFLEHADDMLEKKWEQKRGPNGADRKALIAQAASHRAALLKEWTTKVQVKHPGPQGARGKAPKKKAKQS